MSKKTTYILSALAILCLGLAVWFFYRSRTPNRTVVNPGVLTAAVATTTKAQTGANAAVGNTNPFKANVNPIQGYKNPFE
jgi:hypothetical protein